MACTEIVRIEPADPPEATVRFRKFGEIAMAPPGNEERVTLPLNPLRLLSKIDMGAELPGVMIRGRGADETVKSGAVGLTTLTLR